MDPFFISTTSCIVEGKCTMEGILEGDAVAYSYNEVISNIYERSGSMPRKLIMCGNHPVLAFEYDPESGRACSSGEVLDPMRLPLEFTTHGKSALYAKRIDEWWKSRAIPSTRDGIRRVLESLGAASRRHQGATREARQND